MNISGSPLPSFYIHSPKRKVKMATDEEDEAKLDLAFDRPDFLGKKASYNNPATTLTSLVSKRQKLQEELHTIEKQVYELETSYLQESSHFGNAFKGFDGLLSASRNTTNLKRSRKLQPEDRIFSLSSVTSPVAEEQGVGREDGRSDIGQGRPKVGGLATNGQGKPKRGRTGARDGKKVRQSSDLDPDDEDDTDLSLR